MNEDKDQRFYLGTIQSASALGVTIQLDGDDAPMTKRFKYIYTGASLTSGARVLVLKMSGTYIIIGLLYGVTG